MVNKPAKIVLPLIAAMAVSFVPLQAEASSKSILKYGAIGLGAAALYGIGHQAARTQPYYTTEYPQNNPNYGYQQPAYQYPQQQQYYQQPQYQYGQQYQQQYQAQPQYQQPQQPQPNQKYYYQQQSQQYYYGY